MRIEMSRPASKNRKARVNICLDSKTRRIAKRMAKADNRSLSSYLEVLVHREQKRVLNVAAPESKETAILITP